MTDSNGEDKPPWNDELARLFLGKHIIIGITRVTADDEPLDQQQMASPQVQMGQIRTCCEI